jgi:hypothetical protein
MKLRSSVPSAFAYSASHRVVLLFQVRLLGNDLGFQQLSPLCHLIHIPKYYLVSPQLPTNLRILHVTFSETLQALCLFQMAHGATDIDHMASKMWLGNCFVYQLSFTCQNPSFASNTVKTLAFASRGKISSIVGIG